MAMTRRYLKGMGLSEAQIEGVISAHTETVNGLKGEIEAMKGDSERLKEVQRELDGLDDWKARHDAVLREFDAYRAEQDARQRESEVRSAYRKLLEREHIDPKRYDVIERATALDSLRLNESGGLEDAEQLAEAIRRDWSDFVVKYERRPARVQTPPAGDRRAPSRDEILAIRDTAERQRAIAENHEVFGF